MHFPIIALVGRYQDSDLHAPLRALAKLLIQEGSQVLIEADTARQTGLTEYPSASFTQIGEQASLAIVMGGDGTMLGAARPWLASTTAAWGSLLTSPCKRQPKR